MHLERSRLVLRSTMEVGALKPRERDNGGSFYPCLTTLAIKGLVLTIICRIMAEDILTKQLHLPRRISSTLGEVRPFAFLPSWMNSARARRQLSQLNSKTGNRKTVILSLSDVRKHVTQNLLGSLVYMLYLGLCAFVGFCFV